jgi:acyl-CoA synthetase (AMP-forming)/AMP-acid ligase II
MLEDLLRRKPYNAAADFVDAPVARGFGKKIAFIDPDHSLTYAELQERTCRFAAALQSLGLRPEERLALLIYDNVDFPVAFWGGIRAGNVVLPLNTLLTAEQYAYILVDSRAACQDDPFGSRSAAAPAHRHIDRCRRHRDRSIFRPRCA